MTEAPLRRHRPIPGRWRDHRGRRICTCGSVEFASVHAVPEISDEQREHERRKVGERESTQDTETR